MPPVGFKRSRALWEEARRPNATYRTQLQAILYELQPIRVVRKRKNTLSIVPILSILKHVLCVSLPTLALVTFRFVTSRTLFHWLMVGGVLVYYYFLKWCHELLDAGPVVLIVTALVAIGVFGFSDDDPSDDSKKGKLSAYAVFNRGMERLLGSVDADALLAQHVGGGMMGGGGGENGVLFRVHNNNDEEFVARRRRRPPPPQQQHEEDDENGGDHANDDGNDDIIGRQQAAQQGGQARKTGKKARRRRDVDQRREIQRQRDAARDLQEGEQGIAGLLVDQNEESIEMQRMIEAQILAQQNN